MFLFISSSHRSHDSLSHTQSEECQINLLMNSHEETVNYIPPIRFAPIAHDLQTSHEQQEQARKYITWKK
jgi:hypothetical protein